MANVLFICSRNYWRSLTAEHIFKNRTGFQVRSAGTAMTARRRVKASDIVWADIIMVMEKKHEEIIHHRFAEELQRQKIICLHIPDNYRYCDPVLIELLETAWVENFS